MAVAAGTIMVVNHAASEAENLKELIEFMDTPLVCLATPESWREQIGAARIEAVFAGPDLSEREIKSLVDDIGELDPNIPIVMLNNAAVE